MVGGKWGCVSGSESKELFPSGVPGRCCPEGGMTVLL